MLAASQLWGCCSFLRLCGDVLGVSSEGVPGVVFGL